MQEFKLCQRLIMKSIGVSLMDIFKVTPNMWSWSCASLKEKPVYPYTLCSKFGHK